ncbi:MAG TPA: hypothetical protein VHK47_00715 [Polyangia bacterium]|jgi:hypothetical protein|nr:hypothetical protein [Polyangia bacterium]
MSPSFCVDASPALRATALAALLLAVGSGAACSGGGSATPNDGAAGTGTAGTTGAAGTTGGAGTTGAAGENAVVGAFAIKLVETMGTNAAHTTITGVVKDGPQPDLVHFVAGTKDGSCALYTPEVPFCSTPCGSAACVADDTCQAYPTAKNVGTVTVDGLAGAAGFALSSSSNSYTTGVGFSPSYPPFTEGADVSVSASGADYAAFSIHAKAIAPLVLPSSAITLQKNQPLELTWTAAGAAADSAIHVQLDVSHHGGTKGQIRCDAPDTGSLTISAALVTQLINLGFSGYPSITVTRSSSGEATIAPGRVQLVVSQDIERYVQIPGLVSCTDDKDCPTGQTCQDDLQCK